MSAVLDTAHAAAQPPAASSLWTTRCPVPTASGIAQHKRWLHGEFARSGIALESIRASQDRGVRESHFRHSLPGSFREGGNVPPIWTRSCDQQTAVVAITWVDEVQFVLVRAESDLHAIGDLRGRRLGVVRKPASELVDVGRAEGLRGLLTGLRLGGVGRDEVTWVDLPSEEWDRRDAPQPAEERRDVAVEALLAGTVDAVFVKGTAGALALDRGLRPILDLNEQADPLLRISAGSPRPVTVDRATLERAPDLVDRYLAVLLKTAQWALSRPDEVVATIAAETGASEAAVRRAFGPTLHLAFEPSLIETYVTGLRDQKDWLLAEGFIANDFDLDDWIDPTPLARARTLAPTIELRADH